MAGAHPVLAKDVHVASNKDKFTLLLRTSKTHWLDVKPQEIKISSTDKHVTSQTNWKGVLAHKFCPYHLLRCYVKIRPKYVRDNEPFFVFRDRTPVTPYQISEVLRKALVQCNVNPVNFSMHGLQAGCSVDLFNLGVSVETIKKLGRWKSNAVFLYLM